MSPSVEIMMLLIMKNISVSHVAHFSTVEVAQFCIGGNKNGRITFRFNGEHAETVNYEDYH